MTEEILITYGHDYSQPPIGRYVRRSGRQFVVFNEDAGITEDQVNMINGRLLPVYTITKSKDGKVLECEIIGFAVVPKSGENDA